MKKIKVDPHFWSGKKVFLTGHTGFKGGWLSLWLSSMGAKVTGYALNPFTSPSLHNTLGVDKLVQCSYIADIRDLSELHKAMAAAQPELVIHMAAQPLVRHSYANPVETYSTNVMGTVNVLESIRKTDSVRAAVVVTTDKCYENKEWVWGYRENDPMGGHDPYSSSKGCAELVTSAYQKSFFTNSKSGPYIASARAGNVIGGGDWSEDRLLPDAIRAFEASQRLMIRNPMSTRPWQHVLEPLSGYLMLAQALYDKGSSFSGAWNFGPRDEDNRTVEEVIDLLISKWGPGPTWKAENSQQPHEANLLKLDCSKAYAQLNWAPLWGLDLAISKIVEWQKALQEKQDMRQISLTQINEYMSQ